MNLEQALIFDLGWVFFLAWGTVLAAVSAITFGRDILPFRHAAGDNKRR